MKTAIPKIILFITLAFSTMLHAQGVDDAILNSQTYYEGTSRSMAMGNATGAMGGDVTSFCINPAGMGLYRSSEFTFTTGLQHTLIHSSFYGDNQNAGKMRMTIPSMGAILSSEFSNYSAVRYVQLGIGFTRTNDFNFNSLASGINPKSSMVDAFLQTVNGIDELFDPNTKPGDYFSDNYPYDLSPAWETFLFDQYVDESGNIFYNSPVPQGNVLQCNNVTSKGRTEEWALALSSNLYDKLFVGASVGLSHLKRISKRVYSETPADENDPLNTFDKWEYTEELGDTAKGVNFKCGVIYHPSSWLRIGAAWHSRTRYSFTESWRTEISTMLKSSPDGENYHRYLSPVLFQTYEFLTPNTFIGSLAFIIGQRGLVTTDVEYLDYGSSRFEYSFSGVNDDINALLKPTFNIRLGTEWRVRQFYLRSGIAYYGSPYGFGNPYGSVKKVAVGIGHITNRATLLDFAYELTESTTSYTPYSYFEDGQNIAGDVIQRRWRNKLMVTLKIKL